MNLGRWWRSQKSLFHWLGWSQFQPSGFYVPYRYAPDAKPLEADSTIPWLLEKMQSESQNYLRTLSWLKPYASRLAEFQIEDPANVNRPRFNQDWFPGLDGAMAYAIVRHLKPKLIMEIGSGHSTRFMHQARLDEGSTTKIHSIDPVPRREIDAICDQITRRPVTEVPVETFSELKENDILFIDGSHVLMPGTDVDYLFTQIVPTLKPGVLLHVHDIFLPYGYPKIWKWRAYNEQSILAALIAGGRYEILSPHHFLRRNHQMEVAGFDLPRPPTAMETSFWLRVHGEIGK